MSGILEMSLAVPMILLGNWVAASGCFVAALLFGILTRISVVERKPAVVELRRAEIVGRALGQTVLQLAVGEVTSTMRIGPRAALLRVANQKVVMELQPESLPVELDVLLAHLRGGVSAGHRSTVALDGERGPQRLAVPVAAFLWIAGLMFLPLHPWSWPSPAALAAASLGILVAGQIFTLVVAVACMQRASLLLGDQGVTIRAGPVDEVLSFARVRAIELDEARLSPTSIRIAFTDGTETRVTPLAREETPAVASEMQRLLARSQALPASPLPPAPVARAEKVRTSEPLANVVPLEPRGVFGFFGDARASLFIGADGVLLRRGGKTTFFAFAELRAVSVTPIAEGTRGSRAQVVLHGDDGRSHEVGTSREPMDAGSLSLRLAQEVRAHHGEAPAGAERLARGSRSIGRWRAELVAARGPAVPELAFRSSALEDEHLRDILASPRATLEERVGAALALRETSPELRARIRIEASATADPRLRVALEAVAEDELDERRLEAALRGAGGLRS